MTASPYFQVDQETGTLTALTIVSSGWAKPGNVSVNLSGWLLLLDNPVGEAAAFLRHDQERIRTGTESDTSARVRPVLS